MNREKQILATSYFVVGLLAIPMLAWSIAGSPAMVAAKADEPIPQATTVVPPTAIPTTALLTIPVRISHYWPPLGGPNCSAFVNGECVSKMASGKRWQDWVDKACACPPEWSFGTTVTFNGATWTCMDRGGKIKYVDGIPWVDLLQEKASYPYGTIVDAAVVFAER